MASITLTKQQLALNKIIKKQMPSITPFSSIQYRDNPKAQELLKSYQGKLDKTTMFADTNFNLMLYKHIMTHAINNPDDVTMIKESTARLFKLGHEVLVSSIACEEYMVSYQDDINNEPSKSLSPIGIKLQQYKEYSSLVMKFKEQQIKDHKEWSTSPKAKHEYKKRWKALPETILFKDNQLAKQYLEYFNNYGINQHLKAKAEFLLKLDLPNINSIQIAKKIAEFSAI